MSLWARAVSKYKAALSWITPLFLFLTILIPLASLASQSLFHLICFLSPCCLSCSLHPHVLSALSPSISFTSSVRFLLSLCLASTHALEHTRMFSPFLHWRRGALVPRQTGWSHGGFEEGGRERWKEFIRSDLSGEK